MGNTVVLPPITPVTFTQYKNVSRSEMNAYYSLLRAYNAPFKRLVKRGPNNTIQIDSVSNYAANIYNPPDYLRRPPWVASEKDLIFEQDIATYQVQLVNVYKNFRDGRMVSVLNNPPEPQQPPSQYIKDDTVVPTPYDINAVDINAVDQNDNTNRRSVWSQVQSLTDDPAQQKYAMTWLEGMQYISGAQNYPEIVKYNPPPKGADFATALKHYTLLYEQIRGLHAFNTGNDLFTLPFNPPTGNVSNNSTQSVENFTDATTYVCVKNNTDREQWYLNQVVNIEGKRKLQAEFCRQKGLQYNTTKQCSIFECEQPDAGITTEDHEPDTSKKYLYNQYKFTASQYPAFDNSDYTDKTNITEFKQANIDLYFKNLAKYNFNWINNNGWRKLENNKIYNPPIPAWITSESATGADKQFLNAIDEFNEQALEKLQRFNNYEPMNLPTDFGTLPDMPPYPNALYKMLENPEAYIIPSAIGTIPSASTPRKPFKVPIEQLPQIYNSVKKQNPPPPAKPKCSTQNSCILYDDEVSPAAQKLLDEMLKKKAERVSTAGYEYAMSKPQPSQEVITAKLNSFYDSIRPEILQNIKNFINK